MRKRETEKSRSTANEKKNENVYNVWKNFITSDVKQRNKSVSKNVKKNKSHWLE